MVFFSSGVPKNATLYRKVELTPGDYLEVYSFVVEGITFVGHYRAGTFTVEKRGEDS